ncbi:hypothetical protein O1611_g3744 [Lasiodiplodia mahajangana]|uniref:Uncharacterized protein n=1 Tax=Lasiodiplodia mahajangana TaxID=1108764 RepID=A0ACC2JR42_9PEZI|nr:hypothetical protein O1611_g3744 [Lasiodiplodia mahajangana]
MSGHEARAFLKWTLGGTPSSTVKRDKQTQAVYFERPKQKGSSSKRSQPVTRQALGSHASGYLPSSTHSQSSYYSKSVRPSDSISQVSVATRPER